MPSVNSVSAVMARADEVRPWQEDLYRDLHQNPELSHQEHRTAASVAERLGRSGYQVTTGVNGTGVVGVLRNGAGPTVLLRADMDALPVREDTGLPYASSAVATRESDGVEVPVMHACGHDMHTACLLGAAHLLAAGEKHWRGTLVTVFQPAEETIDGAKGMVADGLAELTGPVDVALGQHVAPLPAGRLATIPGPAFAGGASLRVTLHGRGGHASTPQNTIDPVVLAAAIVLRLQGVVAREIEPGEPAVLTVGSLQAGTKANIIADRAELLVNIRFYSDATRAALLAAIRRIVTAECAASGCPRDPDFDIYEEAPLTDNDPTVTAAVREAFAGSLGEQVMITPPRVLGSEDFSDIANGVGAPYSFWLFGGTDPDAFAAAEAAGTLASDIPGNHSPHFAPVIQPTLDTGTAALVAAALAWLGGQQP
ncbi:MAG: amidohydrolase [Mycobacterium sp.]